MEDNANKTTAETIEVEVSDLFAMYPVLIIISFFAVVIEIFLNLFRKKKVSTIEVKVKKKGMIRYD